MNAKGWVKTKVKSSIGIGIGIDKTGRWKTLLRKISMSVRIVDCSTDKVDK